MQNDKEEFKKNFIKRLIRFSLGILKFAKELRKDRNLWEIIDQLIDSACSIGANIIEAKASSSKRDYIHFFEIALKSANETIYWLIIIKESDAKHRDKADYFLKEANEIAKIIGASILTLKNKK